MMTSLSTEDKIAIIKSEHKRTAIGSRKIANSPRNAPETLTLTKINNILNGASLNLLDDEFIFLRDLYATYPDHNRILITDDIIEEIKMHQTRTNVSVYAVLSGKRHIKPQGLTGALASTWLEKGKRKVKTARADYLTFFLDEFRKIPDAKK